MYKLHMRIHILLSKRIQTYSHRHNHYLVLHMLNLKSHNLTPVSSKYKAAASFNTIDSGVLSFQQHNNDLHSNCIKPLCSMHVRKSSKRSSVRCE